MEELVTQIRLIVNWTGIICTPGKAEGRNLEGSFEVLSLCFVTFSFTQECLSSSQGKGNTFKGTIGLWRHLYLAPISSFPLAIESVPWMSQYDVEGYNVQFAPNMPF